MLSQIKMIWCWVKLKWSDAESKENDLMLSERKMIWCWVKGKWSNAELLENNLMLSQKKMIWCWVKEKIITRIRPIVEYACQVWHPGLTQEQSECLESIQKQAIKIMYKKIDY